MIFVYLKYKSYTFCCFRLFTQSHIKNNLQLPIALLNVPDKVGITLLDLVEPVSYFYSLLPVACQQLVKRVMYVTIYLALWVSSLFPISRPGWSPAAAIYVLPTVFIFSIAQNLGLDRSCKEFVFTKLNTQINNPYHIFVLFTNYLCVRIPKLESWITNYCKNIIIIMFTLNQTTIKWNRISL